MTRINTIDPKLLADQHLIAEHREYGIAVYSCINSLNSKKGIDLNNISPVYTLNKGHVYFFYNKMLYLKNRHQLLKDEAAQRGFKLQLMLDWNNIPSSLMNDWTPTHSDHLVNVDRIITRINQKPNWYRYHSQPLNNDFYKLYQQYLTLPT